LLPVFYAIMQWGIKYIPWISKTNDFKKLLV
jgi:hypothetical protein